MGSSQSLPSRLGRYRIDELLFHSHSSQVYRGLDPVLGRPVAVKRALEDGPGTDDGGEPETVRRLRREAEIRAALDHPHLLALHDATLEGPEVFLVGPLLPGEPLSRLLRQGELSPGVLAAWVSALGSALDALAEAGWVHGDFHARNVLLARDGRPVLIDFASARRRGERWCTPGEPARLLVTPQIVAPEVWRGEPVGPAADLYALGALLYRGLTGGYPFDDPDPAALPELHIRAPIPSLAPLLGEGAAEIDRVVARALAKDPGERYPSGSQLAAAAVRALERLERRTLEPVPEAAPGTEGDRAGTPPSEPAPPGSPAAAADPSSNGTGPGPASRSTPELASLTTQVFGVPASLVALERIGAADAMAAGAATVPAIARACGAPEHTVARLLEVLCSAGLAGHREGRFVLPPPLGEAYSRARSVGRRARPVHQGLRFWGHLPRWARHRRPYLEMDRDDGSRYSSVVGLLGDLFDRRAERLAELLAGSGRLPRDGHILDVGAGSGVWGLTLANGAGDGRVTAVDRPAVLEVLERRAREAGLGERLRLLPGDWRRVPLPQAAFDLVILANLCHLEPGREVARLLAKTAPALRPGGHLVVVDTIPEDRRRAPVELLLYGLRLALRTAGGDLHDLRSFRSWLDPAGLVFERLEPLGGSSGTLSALLARRPEPGEPAGSPGREPDA